MAERCMVREALVLLEWKVEIQQQLLLARRDAAGDARAWRVQQMPRNLGCEDRREDSVFESFLRADAGRAEGEARLDGSVRDGLARDS